MDPCKLLNIQGIMSCPAAPRYHQSAAVLSSIRLLNRPKHSRPRRLKALVDQNIAEPAQVQVTWQIVSGALAGVTPFVVAGLEFNKRIVAQRQCKVCNGSGLVLRDKKYYFRCPKCGGFLPWQSWKRFFTG